jgi:hypothetical protein
VVSRPPGDGGCRTSPFGRNNVSAVRIVFSETVAQFLIDRIGLVPYLAFAAAVMLVVPVGLAWLVLAPLVGGTRGPWYGLALGFAVAVWASLCDLCVPYAGLYPNLPGAILALAVAGSGADATWVGQLCIHATNLILWPSLGWLVFRLRRAGNGRALA